jgi:hypothetical protein
MIRVGTDTWEFREPPLTIAPAYAGVSTLHGSGGKSKIVELGLVRSVRGLSSTVLARVLAAGDARNRPAQ